MEVKPGDVIVSFAKTKIQGIGIAKSYCYECPQPEEFGNAGKVWEKIGWRVEVKFEPFPNSFKPKAHINKIAEYIGITHSPLRENGEGKQGLYLAKISKSFLAVIFEIARYSNLFHASQSGTANELHNQKLTVDTDRPLLRKWEDIEIQRLEENSDMDTTTRDAIVIARVGQGKFRNNVARLEAFCRVTGVDNQAHLTASHIKPWRDSSNEERIVGANGLFLTPNIDHLFDRGFISFENSGDLIVSDIADDISLGKMGVPPHKALKLPQFNVDQKYFLEYHREEILLRKATA